MKFILLTLALVLTSHAAPSDPGKAAINFLEKVRLRQLDLDPGGDTALSAQVIDEKKRKIARRLDRLALELGSAPLEIGSMRMDDNFAGVLVRMVSGFDPSGFRVFPIAMIKRGDSWFPAPVPASFENVDAGYTSPLKQRLQDLENWMLREQISDLEKLRAESSERVLRKIQSKLSAETLRRLSPQQIGSQFLSACQQRDAGSLLGLLGGLASPLPDDWALRLKAVDSLLDPNSARLRPWRLLSAPEVARVAVQHQQESDEGRISIACLDPAGHGNPSSPPRFEILDLKLTRDQSQLWQVHLPSHFLDPSAAAADADDPAAGESNPDLLNEFPKRWLAEHSAAALPSAASAFQALSAAFQASSPAPLLSLVNLAGEPRSARGACIEATRLWWSIHSPTAYQHAMPLAFRADESAAVGLFQFFSTREPDQLDVEPVFFQRGPGGWHWAPIPAPATLSQFETWIATETRRWSGQWQEKLLADSSLLDPGISGPCPSPADARNTVEAWLAATQRGDVTAALATTARFNDARSNPITIQNLGYEIAASHGQNLTPAITGIYQGSTWTAVGVRTTRAGKVSHPLYPVIQTPAGPRIVIEIDLFAFGNRGRDFLNKAALDRLRKLSSPTLADELRNLYTKHQASIEKSTD